MGIPNSEAWDLNFSISSGTVGLTHIGETVSESRIMLSDQGIGHGIDVIVYDHDIPYLKLRDSCLRLHWIR